jgi:membrane protease YdiL (CAAX protease family)
VDEMAFKERKPLLLIIWSFGLFVLIHTSQYSGIWLASRLSGTSFDAVASGEVVNHLTVFAGGLNALIIGVPVAFLVVKYLWRRSSEWMCLNFNFRLFLSGVVLGLFLPVLIVLILYLFGALDVAGYPDRLASRETILLLIGFIGLSLFTGIVEELVFRGMVARELAKKWGWAIAAIVSGIYFGFVHILSGIMNLSPGNALWIISGALLVNLLIVAMYVRSKSLWLPIGFHAGWNFCLAAVIGVTMSGDESTLGLFEMKLKGSVFLTGGDFGLETSVVSMAVYVIATLFFLRYGKAGEVSFLNPSPED